MSSTQPLNPSSSKQPTALLGWEWGEGLGHLANLGRAAAVLVEAGYKVIVATPDRKAAARVIKDPRVSLIQTPPWRRRTPSGLSSTPRFSEILYNFGFTDLPCVSASLTGWKRLLQTYKPAIILSEFAPGLLAASHGYPARRIVMGSSYSEPNPSKPSLLIDEREACEPDLDLHDAVLDNLNAVLSRLRISTIESLADLYVVDQTILTTLPEIDVYRARADAVYLGPLSHEFDLPSASWSHTEGKKVLAYLKGRSFFFHFLMSMLASSDCEVIAYAPDARSSEYLSFQREGMRLFTEPLDAMGLAAEADLVVGHGGNGLLCQALLAGKPQLLAPNHLEQYLNAEKVVGLGAGLIVDDESDEKTENAFRKLLQDDSFSLAAKQISHKYSLDSENQHHLLRIALIG